jgi:hypothetical protein
MYVHAFQTPNGGERQTIVGVTRIDVGDEATHDVPGQVLT